MSEQTKIPGNILAITEDRETFQRDVFLNERAVVHDLLQQGPGNYEVDLKFPAIIDEVPDDEKERFTNLPLHIYKDFSGNSAGRRELSLSELASVLPGTAAIIAKDFALLGINPPQDQTGRGGGATSEVRRELTYSHEKMSWHMDGVDAGFAPVFDMFYLISDVYPTAVFEGPATAHLYKPYEDSDRLRFELEELRPGVPAPNDFNGQGTIAFAPPYGIMRMNAMSVHSMPPMDEEVERTLMRIWLTPDVEPYAA